MDDRSKAAKAAVIAEFLQMLQDGMGHDTKSGLDALLAKKMPSEPLLGAQDGVQSVKVIAPDQAGLEKGLDLAKNVLPQGDEQDEPESKVEMAAEAKDPALEAKEDDGGDDDLYSQMQRKKAKMKLG